MTAKSIVNFIKHLRLGFYQYLLLGFIFSLIINKVSFSLSIMFAFISWFFLCAGSGLINNYYDKDKKAIAFLKNPPKATKSILYGSFIFKLIGLIIAIIFTNKIFILLYIIGAIMSILYSHKNVRLKSNGKMALLINSCSGGATYLAAATFSSNIYTWTNLMGIIASSLMFGAIYLLMQIHQTDEDKKRKDKSIAMEYGPKKALRFSLFLAILSGIICIYLLYFVSLILVIAGILFFTFLSIYVNNWRKEKTSKKIDYERMKEIVTYPVTIITSVLLIFYLIKI